MQTVLPKLAEIPDHSMFLEKGCLKALLKFLISYLKFLEGLSLPGDCEGQTKV